jgi:ubiquinone/menaquinone biosynthesis C-methylase UbiE
MPAAVYVIIVVVILLLAILLIWLRLHHYRIYYLNLNKLFSGKWSFREVGKHYDEWTPKFLESGYKNVIQAHRSENIEETLDYIIQSAGINDGMRLIDAGCGVCGPAIYFAQKKQVEIECITNSIVQKQIGQSDIEKHQLQNRVRVYHHDFHQLEKILPAGSFDMVYFLESYGHATNQTLVLQSAYRMLKPGGLIYIKDYFALETHDDLRKNLRMWLGIKNMNKTYRYNMPDLYHTIYVLRKMQMQLVKIQRPSFSWDNDKVLMEFEQKNNINLFEGKEVVNIVSPLEMLFLKPANPPQYSTFKP